MELLDKHLDGLLDEAEADELCRWVKEDPRHARIVTRAAMIHQRLRQVMRGRQLLEEAASLGASLDDAVILPAIRLEPESETAMEIAEAPEGMQSSPATPAFRYRYWRLVAGIALPILVGVALWSILGPAKPTGALVASADAVWENPAQAPRAGTPLPRGPLNLTSGVAQMRLENGVSLILEGPAKLEVQSETTVRLTLGKLTVSVPPNAHGFTVETPAARTVDLGTEFGVLVDSSGNTETHVIRGTVEMTPVAGSAATHLTAGNAARVGLGAISTQKIAALTGSFVQDVPAIDLVDVVSGGDGTTRRCDSGIDIGSGGILPLPTDRRAMGIALSRDIQGDGRFHPCPGRTLVGGIFIPHGSPTPDTVDPSGHQFIFPTTNNHAYNDLWPRDLAVLDGSRGPNPDVIGSVDYAGSGHRLLLLHANKGICFDLNALRTAHPDRQFSHLQSVCVNLNAHALRKKGAPISDRSEFWVFIDGDLRSHKLIHRTDEPFDVDVPIEAAAHYLALVATDGGDGFDWDVVSLGDPRLN